MSKLSGRKKQVKRTMQFGPVNRKAASLTDDLDVRIDSSSA